MRKHNSEILSSSAISAIGRSHRRATGPQPPGIPAESILGIEEIILQGTRRHLRSAVHESCEVPLEHYNQRRRHS
ncbi:hypothetical protein AYO39_01425 [Actinobacteria bacterium SCGC AG-212-D09]|nr:hypothetical protein AYO39_01425 [Actinobacteria bacterium SCGC AG-212-D09]